MQPLVYSRFSASICSDNIMDSRHRSQECRVTGEPHLQTILIAEDGGHPIISYVVARSWRFTMCHLIIREEENWQTRTARKLSQAGSQVWSLRFLHCPVSWTWRHKLPTHTHAHLQSELQKSLVLLYKKKVYVMAIYLVWLLFWLSLKQHTNYSHHYIVS